MQLKEDVKRIVFNQNKVLGCKKCHEIEDKNLCLINALCSKDFDDIRKSPEFKKVAQEVGHGSICFDKSLAIFYKIGLPVSTIKKLLIRSGSSSGAAVCSAFCDNVKPYLSLLNFNSTMETE